VESGGKTGAHVTIGEISNALRDEFGTFDAQH